MEGNIIRTKVFPIHVQGNVKVSTMSVLMSERVTKHDALTA